MMRRQLVVHLGLWLLFLEAVSGQTPIKDPAALEVLARSSAALGITSTAVSSLVASGTYNRFDAAGVALPSDSIRVKALGPDQIRWETDRPGGTAVTVINQHSGSTRFQNRTTRLAVGETTGRKLEYLLVLALGYWVSLPDTRVGYVGMERISGKDYHRVALARLADVSTSAHYKEALEQITRGELFVDAATNRPAFLRFFEHVGDWRRDTTVDLVFSDFRTTGTVLVPMTVTRYTEGIKTLELRFQTVTLNGTISPSEFVE